MDIILSSSCSEFIYISFPFPSYCFLTYDTVYILNNEFALTCNISTVVMLHIVEFEVFTAIWMQMVVFWVVVPCSNVSKEHSAFIFRSVTKWMAYTGMVYEQARWLVNQESLDEGRWNSVWGNRKRPLSRYQRRRLGQGRDRERERERRAAFFWAERKVRSKEVLFFVRILFSSFRVWIRSFHNLLKKNPSFLLILLWWNLLLWWSCPCICISVVGYDDPYGYSVQPWLTCLDGKAGYGESVQCKPSHTCMGCCKHQYFPYGVSTTLTLCLESILLIWL